ncbi:MAG: GNAT family N-acetyltransferase [Wenzhouxiangella sp.]|nr:MAG: GNAT family N-acetyltransferase [Wenzhouxiangella sp.]
MAVLIHCHGFAVVDERLNKVASSRDGAAVIWLAQSWSELDCERLYAILSARSAVFIVEQTCPYQDLDGLDQQGIHVTASAGDGAILAYGRLLPAGARFEEPSIGRVLTTTAARGTGIGRELMHRCLGEARQRFRGQPIRISAQQYLERFYRELGFVTVRGPYDEDGIPHLEMLMS